MDIKITCVSDTHQRHQELDLPGGDILIHSGDFMSSGYDSVELLDFLNWLYHQPYNHKILVAGNHDRIFEKFPEEAMKMIDMVNHDNSIIYLQDSSCTIDGINFYGSPWTPEFCGWAFQIHNDYEDTEHWRKIPKDTDVLITHGPAHGILDEITTPLTMGANPGHLGSKALRRWIDEHSPKLHVCGHIHSAQGVLDGYGEVTTHINAACLGEDYKYSNANKYIEWKL